MDRLHEFLKERLKVKPIVDQPSSGGFKCASQELVTNSGFEPDERSKHAVSSP